MFRHYRGCHHQVLRTYLAPSGLYPYLGYDLGLWTYSGPPVKTVDRSAQHKYRSKCSQSIAFNTLTFYAVKLCVLVATGVRLRFVHWTSWEGLLELT